MAELSAFNTDPRFVSPWGTPDLSIGALLTERALDDADYPYCRFGNRVLTIGELERTANKIANGMIDSGLKPGDRVATMLTNSIDYIALFFAMTKVGLIQVPINLHLRGEGLAYILGNADCSCLIAEGSLADVLQPLLCNLKIAQIHWRRVAEEGTGLNFRDLQARNNANPPPTHVNPDDTIYISYTSGTTGMPKGVLLTDRMLRVAASAASLVADPQPGDIFHLWAPFYHIGGCEVLILAVQHRVTIGLVPKFSVSGFWNEIRELGATQIQFLGGVIALLLKQPQTPRDRDHNVKVAWGGGCPEPAWRAFQDRFGIPIRECYGLTECASFATQNRSGKIGSIGKPLPYFDVSIVDDDGRPVSVGVRGEIWIRERVQNVLTKGYWRNPEGTTAALADGVLRTGDLAMRDGDGDFFYLGRKKDSLRRRGENIAAFEVERIINQHPQVEESAIVGVSNDLADEDIKVFLRLKDRGDVDPLDLIKWCEGRMAYFQIPRYVEFVDEFPKTPSLRIRKELLSRETFNCWDLEKSQYTIRR